MNLLFGQALGRANGRAESRELEPLKGMRHVEPRFDQAVFVQDVKLDIDQITQHIFQLVVVADLAADAQPPAGARERVRDEVRNGIVSPEAARAHYGYEPDTDEDTL